MIPEWLNRWLPSEEKYRARVFAILAFIGGLFFSPLASFTMNGTLASVQERAAFYNKVAEINSYRDLPDIVRCSPQIAAAIAGWNARIAVEHESNRHWYTDYFSTDSWNAVEPIRLRCETHE